MNGVLRRLALASIRLLPSPARARLGSDIAATIRALAEDARARGGSAAERAYLLRELADIHRQAWALRRAEAEAARAALPRLGDALRDDLRASLRQWQRRPAATIGVIGTLAIAVAAVTTTFGLATAVLWRPLPFPRADRLLFVWESADDERGPFRVTAGHYTEWQQAPGFVSLSMFGAAGFSLDGADGSVPVRGVRVSASYFQTLGLQPIIGRAFDERDEAPGANRVLILSEAMWRSRFGRSSDIIGRVVRLSGEPYQVVGVMPDVVTPGWPSNPSRVAVEGELREFWVPIPWTPALASNTRAHVFGVVGRLRDGITGQQVEAELLGTASDVADPHHAVTTPFRDQFVRDVRAPLLVLFAASLAVLLVACANLAALQVSRFEQRRGELVTRAALGAGRVRLAGLLMMDAALLSLAGGAVGVGLARPALEWVPGQLPASMPFVTAPRLDGAAAVAATLTALLITVALALWPALRLSTLSVSPRGAAVPARTSVYRWLVAGQVAVGVALAVPAALLGESLTSLRAREPGFQVDHVLVADVSIGGQGAPDLARTARFEQSVRNAAATVPGVEAVAVAYDHPLEANWTETVSLRGEVRSDSNTDVDAQLRIVSPSYFEALGVRVLDGRTFEEREDTGTPGVVLVNEAFAAAHGGRVIGRHLRSGGASYTWGPSVPADYEIVGVVENERFRGLDLPSAPAIYLSTRQFPQVSATLIVRTSAVAPGVSSGLRPAIRAAAPDATIGQVRLLSGILAEQLTSRRVTADVAGLFAAAAVGLSVLGLYGLMAVVVAGRTRDVGVRLALGASPAGIARAVLIESLGAAAVGVVAGVLLAMAVGRFLEHLLVDVSARDPWTLAAVSSTVLLAAVLAAVVPARRAASIDPVIALRADG